jgi:tetratricopeptide (TPR) repeat protein
MKKYLYLIIVVLICSSANLNAQSSQDCGVSYKSWLAGSTDGYAVYFQNFNISQCNVICELIQNGNSIRPSSPPFIKRYQNGKIEIGIGEKLYVYTKSEGLKIKYLVSGNYKEEEYAENVKVTKSSFVNGSPNNIKREQYNGSIQDLVNKALDETRNEMKGYNIDTLRASETRLPLVLYRENISYKKELLQEIKDFSLKSNPSDSECEEMYLSQKFARQGGFYEESIMIMNLIIKRYANSNLQKEQTYTHLRGLLYEETKKYALAINDYKRCAQITDNENDKGTFYYTIGKCYEALGDKKNAGYYQNLTTNSINQAIQRTEELAAAGNANSKKFCYKMLGNSYELNINQGGSRTVTYKLFNSQGILQKTIQGNWNLRDEGAYGSAYKLTLTWTGLNSKMEPLVFLCQYDAFGSIQGLIDSQNRSWDKCN